MSGIPHKGYRAKEPERDQRATGSNAAVAPSPELRMAEIVGGSVRQPAGHDPIRALLRAGRNDQAIVQLCAILVTRPDDLVARELLFEAFYNKGHLEQ
jgi:hypothetical protein